MVPRQDYEEGPPDKEENVMKKIGTYTIRGSVLTDRAAHKIQLFDGKFDTGYRLVSFEMFPSVLSSGTFTNVSGKLSTDELPLPTAAAEEFNADNNAEIAWSQFMYDATPASNPYFIGPSSVIDPDNLIVEDLYLYASENSASISDLKVNYVMTFEKYEFNDWQGALSMVRNRSQA